MSEQDAPAAAEESPSKRSQMKSFFKSGFEKGVAKSKEELLKGKLYLEHQAGLGHKPNVIPPGKAELTGKHRMVEVGWHPVAGLAGKWFAEKTGLGKIITEKINNYPDPTQHWAVLVGDYCHQLWMDEHLDVIYINEKIKREEWHTFEVGKTRLNDEALRQASEMVIFNMRSKKAAYNLINNNCQNFAVHLLEAVQVGGHRQFATSLAVYERAFGKGKIMDLFAAQETEQQTSEEPVAAESQAITQNAQNIMKQNTTMMNVYNPH